MQIKKNRVINLHQKQTVDVKNPSTIHSLCAKIEAVGVLFFKSSAESLFFLFCYFIQFLISLF